MPTIEANRVLWHMRAGSYFRRTIRRKLTDGTLRDISGYTFECVLNVTIDGVAATRSFVCQIVSSGDDANKAVTVEMFATTGAGVVQANTNEGIDAAEYDMEFRAIPTVGGAPKSEVWLSGKVNITARS